MVREVGGWAHFLVGAVPDGDGADAHRASTVSQGVDVHVGLDEVHEWIEGIEALDAEHAVANGEGPHPSGPARFEDLLGAGDSLPNFHHFLCAA